MPPRPLGRPVGQRRPPGMDRLVVQEPLQIVGQFLGRGVAALRLGGNRFQDDRFQVARDGVVDLSRRGRIAVDNLMHQDDADRRSRKAAGAPAIRTV